MMNMRKISLICAVLLIVSVNLYAQDFSEANGLKSEKAEKIDEFGRVGECDMGARLDNLLVTLQNNSALKGIIVVYQGADVLPANYDSPTAHFIRRYRNYIRFRNFDPSRVEIIDGGFRKEKTTELWIVPPGAPMPQPSETVPRPTLPTGKTFLYDVNIIIGNIYYEEFLFENPDLYEYLLPAVKAERKAQQKALEEEWKSEENSDESQTIEEETEPEQPKTPEEIEEEKFFWTSDKFGEVIKNQKDASGVIIFYADDSVFDIARLQRFIIEGRNKIAGKAEILPSKIQILFGGYRASAEAEFWIMPKNGAFPTPSPETRPVEEPEDETDEENF